MSGTGAERSIVVERLYGESIVRVDADVGSGLHAVADDGFGIEFGMFEQGAGRGAREVATRTDGNDALLRFDHVTVSRDHQRGLGIGNREQGLEPSEHAIGTPLLGKLHRSTNELAAVFLEPGFETLEQREGVGSAAGEPRQHTPLMQAAHLPCIALHDDIAHRNLSVSTDHDAVSATHGADGRAPELFHA